jgi:hypothetical protein
VKNTVLRLEFVVPKANEKVAFGARSYLLILARMRRLFGKSSRRIQDYGLFQTFRGAISMGCRKTVSNYLP